MTRVRFLALIPALILFGLGVAHAQGICQMGQPTPKVVTASTYTLTARDGCGFIVFSGGGAVTVTNDQTAVQSFMVTLVATAGSVTINPAAGMTTVNSQASMQLMTYQPMTLVSDGTANYWLLAGGPVPAQNTVFGQPSLYPTPGLQPGTTVQNTPVLLLPGIPQLSSPAAWQANPRAASLFEMCRGAPPVGDGSVTPNPTKTPAWLSVIDNLGQPRVIPVC